MRASFFDYDPTISGYRYILLTEEDPTLETGESHQTDEGFSAVYTRWTLRDGVVYCQTDTDGRDCDGRMCTTTVFTCPVADLAAREVYTDGNAEASESGPLPFRVPAWERSGYGQRDYSAEAAGY